MLMSIAWLYDIELYQCLSPGCLTTNLVFFSCETVDHLITWLLSEWEFCNFITSRGWADSDQLILCLPVAWPMTSDHVVICSPAVWPKLPFYLMSPMTAREASDHLITCLSFRLSIGNLVILPLSRGCAASDHLIVSWLYDQRLLTWGLRSTPSILCNCPVCVTIYLAIRHCQKKATVYLLFIGHHHTL
jgi:hypothetical protein